MENQKLNVLCEEFFKENHVFAMDVAIHQKGETVYSFRLGNTATHGPKISEKTMFSVGSISKMFTTAAIMMLVEQGKLELDEPVYKKLPMFKMTDARYRNITVRMLLNHSSGLPSNCTKGKYTNARNRQFLREEIEYAAKSRLKDQPGMFSVYCNDGFALAELLIEVVSGQSFSSFIYDHIVEPLKMEHTDFPIHEIMEGKFVHAPSAFDLDYPQEYVNGIGSGGIYSTAEDLCRFMDGYQQGKILNENSMAEMDREQQPKELFICDNTTERYGLGWDNVQIRLFEAMGLKALTKSGSTFGFSSNTLIIPECEISASVVLCTEEAHASALNQKLVAELLKAEGHAVGSLPLQKMNTLVHPVELTGLYGNMENVIRVRFEYGTMTIEKCSAAGEWEKIAEGLNEKDGLFCTEEVNHILGLNNARFGFVQHQDEIYLFADTDGRADSAVAERALMFQKLKPSGKVSAWKNCEGRKWIMDNEYLQQRKIGYVPMTFTVQMEKGYEDLLLAPYPVRIMNDYEAVPCLQIPGNYSREMSSVIWLADGSIQNGQYHYISEDTLKVLDWKELTLRDSLIHWFIADRQLDTVKIDGVARILILNEKDEVEFDSQLSSRLPEDIRGKRIGFMGELNSKITCQYLSEE